MEHAPRRFIKEAQLYEKIYHIPKYQAPIGQRRPPETQ